ncbi:unnamed protein product [Parnassius apollo]|uniref:(apollo) hypothetical protein n=1 Tax=Parnassius apollo TaxID=110799 RepID=A0A8S3XL94_PARAO|nr:unnamed protein product [Parnassius apollo]
MEPNRVYVGHDLRQGLIPGNKTSKAMKQFVKLHIDMFPRIESHYCRKDSKKIYLESDLNMARLYKLYKEEFCPERNINPVFLYVYEKIFKSYDPPLAFYKPKKDQCTKCNVYKSAEDKISLQRDYGERKARKKESLEAKAYDKKESIRGRH